MPSKERPPLKRAQSVSPGSGIAWTMLTGFYLQGLCSNFVQIVFEGLPELLGASVCALS